MSDERKCAWCGADISYLHSNALNCSAECREAKKRFTRSISNGHWPKEMYGPRPAATCPECGMRFEQRDRRQVFCKRNGACHQKSWRRTDRAKTYFSRPEVKQRISEAAQRYAKTDHGKKAQRERDAKPHNKARRIEWAHSEHGRQVKSQYQRERSAQSALAAILLPTHKSPE